MGPSLIKLVKQLLVIAFSLKSASVFAQVSYVEEIAPLDGVQIPRVKQEQLKGITPAGTIFKDCDKCPEMIVIPSGSFMMGSSSEVQVFKEKPQHLVNVQLFAIGKYEVTQDQYYDVIGANPSIYKGNTLPVEDLSWHDAQLYVHKLSRKTGKKYRLPSEAEWEYAARAGSNAQFFWGNDVKQASDYAWSWENSAGSSHPVGSKKPNQFGLFDIFGNASEWTQDCWNEDYSGAPTDGSAWTNGECSKRVLRGGAWNGYKWFFRSSGRNWSAAEFRNLGSGSRVALDL